LTHDARAESGGTQIQTNEVAQKFASVHANIYKHFSLNAAQPH